MESVRWNLLNEICSMESVQSSSLLDSRNGYNSLEEILTEYFFLPRGPPHFSLCIARLTPVFATLTSLFATLTPCGRLNEILKHS